MQSENFDFTSTIALVKMTISPIPNLKLYCRNKNRQQGPKTASYRPRLFWTLNSLDHFQLNYWYIKGLVITVMDEVGAEKNTGSPSLQCVSDGRVLYICDFVWELLYQAIYKTLYGNPLDFSKIYITLNDGITLTYLLPI